MPSFYNRIKARKFSTVADTAIEIAPSSSDVPNLSIDAGGKLNWSSGSVTADTNLYRTSASTMRTDGNFEVAGNLTVNGSTTTINSTTITIDDKNIELGSSATPSDITADGGGLTLKGATDKTILWDNSATPSWSLSENLNLASSKAVKINNTNVLTSSTILGSSTAATIGASTGTTTINNGLVLKQVLEAATIDSVTGLSGSATNIDVLTSSIYYFSGSPSANFAINIRGNSSITDLNDILSTGQTLTISIIVDRAGNTYKLSTVNINGSSQTINWFGGTAPSAGNALDIYSVTVLKTASSTYKVFASQAKFA
jgi:hypothetical protein